MNKKIVSLFTVILLVFVSAIPAFATSSNGMPLIGDSSYLLDDSELQILSDEIEKVSEEANMDITIITLDSLYGDTTEEAAKYWHDEMGYSQDSLMLLVSMEYNDVIVKSFGENGGDVFSESAVQDILDEVTPYLSMGDYYGAFDHYIDLASEYVYDANHFDFFMNILISLGVGLVVALIVVLIMKAQLKTVRFQSAAANYLKGDSLQVTEAYDHFLYRHVTRVAKPKVNSSSDGGHSASGKF